MPDSTSEIRLQTLRTDGRRDRRCASKLDLSRCDSNRPCSDRAQRRTKNEWLLIRTVARALSNYQQPLFVDHLVLTRTPTPSDADIAAMLGRTAAAVGRWRRAGHVNSDSPTRSPPTLLRAHFPRRH